MIGARVWYPAAPGRPSGIAPVVAYWPRAGMLVVRAGPGLFYPLELVDTVDAVEEEES